MLSPDSGAVMSKLKSIAIRVAPLVALLVASGATGKWG
jgi:hypothetical protein